MGIQAEASTEAIVEEGDFRARKKWPNHSATQKGRVQSTDLIRTMKKLTET